ncbi:MAG: hypothetical protein KIT69_12195, partial [Propionibacteriaceae bacterium]|nr:hypothetical protein [Propionibacteriaceae bacterium]
MIRLLPEPKQLRDDHGSTAPLASLDFRADDVGDVPAAEAEEIARLRFAGFPELLTARPDGFPVRLRQIDPAEIEVDEPELFAEQGYVLEVTAEAATIGAASRSGLVNGITSLKALVEEHEARTGGTGGLRLPTCRIVDHPSIPVRAVAATLSWYAGYGRLGFDMQLWGLAEWADYL